MTRLQAWDIVWKALGAKPGESLLEAAERAQYHGHERGKASRLLLALPDDATSDQKWDAILRAAALLKLRVVK